MDSASPLLKHSNITAASGSLHISRHFANQDTTSLQKWLETTAKSTLRTNSFQEKESMADNKFPDKPGYGTLFYTAPEDKKHPQGPDFNGYLVLEMDYKAGERVNVGLWQKQKIGRAHV